MSRQTKNNPILIALWAVVLIATLAVVVVVNVWKGSSSETSLTVQIQALPQHLQADVVIHAPGGRHWVVRQSRTYSQLRDGRYTVTAQPVSSPVFKYSATSRTQMVTLSGGSRTVTVQYLDMVRKSVRSVQIRTCTNGPIAVIGHTLVFSPAALNAKGNGIAQGTALYIPTCGVRPNPVVVLVTSVRLGLGIVAATTQLLSDSGVFPLKAVFPRGEIRGPVRLNSTDRLIKNGYLHENVSLNGCSGVDGSADVRAHLQLTIDGKWGGLGASFSNALHDRLPLPFTTLSLKLQATQSSNLVVLADRTASCTYPITLAEVDLGEWPVDLGIPLTIDPKLEFDAALTVTGAVQASFVAEERFGDTAIVSLAHPKPHVVSSHKLSSKTSSFVATLQSVKVALTPRLELDIDGWPVGVSTSVGLGVKVQLRKDTKSWSLYGWLGAGKFGLNLGSYQPESNWAFWRPWLLAHGSLDQTGPPPAPTSTSTTVSSTTTTSSTTTSTTAPSPPVRLCEPGTRGSSAGRFFGSVGSGSTAEPAVAMACAPDGAGYWLVSAGGEVEAFGTVKGYGSLQTNSGEGTVVGIAATTDGNGYWVAQANGEVVAFGDARRFSPLTAMHLNAPIVGITATPSGQGYWLVASDGGVFAFGDAEFLGSMGSVHLNAPVVGMAASSESGYWLVAQDGGVFAFGSAGFFGSEGSEHLTHDAVGMLSVSPGLGYWIVLDDGTAVPFGAGLTEMQPTK